MGKDSVCQMFLDMELLSKEQAPFSNSLSYHISNSVMIEVKYCTLEAETICLEHFTHLTRTKYILNHKTLFTSFSLRSVWGLHNISLLKSVFTENPFYIFLVCRLLVDAEHITHVTVSLYKILYLQVTDFYRSNPYILITKVV